MGEGGLSIGKILPSTQFYFFVFCEENNKCVRLLCIDILTNVDDLVSCEDQDMNFYERSVRFSDMAQ